MTTEMKRMRLGGSDRRVEVDGDYYGGYVKPSNRLKIRRDRRLAKNQNGKRQVVVVMRERDGRTLPSVWKSESSALAFIAARAPPGTSLMSDEAASSTELHRPSAVARIDPRKPCSGQSGAYTKPG